jgi:hypothetical protein
MRKTSTYARKRAAGLMPNANPFAVPSLLNQARPFEGEEEVQHLIDDHQAAYQRLATGQGSEEDFDNVSMKLNVGLVRAESIDPLLVATMKLGQGAMVRMQARVARGLSFGFDADGLRDVPYALEAFEAILASSSPLQMKHAIQEAWSRITGGDVLGIH